MSIISFSLFGFDGMRDKLWAFSQMGLAKPLIGALPELQFFKLMGTGSGAGFSTRPNFSVYTLLAEWSSLDHALQAVEGAAVFQKYRERSSRMATFYLEPVSSRGSWDGHCFLEGPGATQMPDKPIIALTRARLRMSKALKFWALVPAISRRAESDGQRQFMIGTGEVPLLHQVTFSIWNDAASMHEFAHNSATHGEAVRRAYLEGWFHEYCFARFNLTRFDGSWPGVDPAMFDTGKTSEAPRRKAVSA